jgi:hypothetical protein
MLNMYNLNEELETQHSLETYKTSACIYPSNILYIFLDYQIPEFWSNFEVCRITLGKSSWMYLLSICECLGKILLYILISITLC